MMRTLRSLAFSGLLATVLLLPSAAADEPWDTLEEQCSDDYAQLPRNTDDTGPVPRNVTVGNETVPVDVLPLGLNETAYAVGRFLGLFYPIEGQPCAGVEPTEPREGPPFSVDYDADDDSLRVYVGAPEPVGAVGVEVWLQLHCDPRPPPPEVVLDGVRDVLNHTPRPRGVYVPPLPP